MPDHLTYADKQWHLRQRRHRHNSFHGHIGMCKANMRTIAESDTTTPKAKKLAWKIHDLAMKLGAELKERVDAPN